MKSISRYRQMRLFILYDLPSTTKQDHKDYSKFHNFLLKNGFYMLQYSVYVRLCINHDELKNLIVIVENNKPKKGNARMLIITEKQYENMKVLIGSKSLQEQFSNIKRLVEL